MEIPVGALAVRIPLAIICMEFVNHYYLPGRAPLYRGGDYLTSPRGHIIIIMKNKLFTGGET